MDQAVLRLGQALMKADPNNPSIDQSIMENYQDLISMDEFYLFPKESLFRWAKMYKNLNPEKAKMFFQRMQLKFGTEALGLLEFMTIEPQDPNSCALALSGLENCPLCKNVFDESSCVMIDIDHIIKQHKKEKEELGLLIQKHQEDLENERKLNYDLNLKLSNAQEELTKADNFIKLAKIEKNNLEKELQEVKTKGLAATSDMKKLQDEVLNLQDIKKKLEIDLQKSRDEAARIQVLLNKKNNEEKNPSISLSPSLPPNEFLYKSSLFEGILHGLQLLMNSILDDYVIVTASSSLNSSYIPSNVLKNDDSCWCSWHDGNTVLKPNEWIQFDFKGIKVAINAYAFKVGHSPKSWKIEGSNDNKSFTIIHNMTLNEDFKLNSGIYISYNDPKGEKLYTLDKVSDMFRYIRISQGDDGNWNFTSDPKLKHAFGFYRIELFGYYQQ